MRSRTFQLKDIDWSLPIDRTKPWSPAAIAPMTYLPSYAKLSEAQRLRYNQLFSLGICEQFIWFERDLLNPVLERVLKRKRVSGELRAAVIQFIEDEEKHAEMFWRLLERAEPQLYVRRKYFFLNMNNLQRASIRAMVTKPEHFLVWIWAAIFFEERTLDYSRHYVLAQKETPELIDPLFSRCHRLHLVDEARHHEIDFHLLNELYDPEPWAKKKLAGVMMRRLMKNFASPRRISWRIIERLAREFGGREPSGVYSALWRELPLLGQSREFHQVAFGKQAVGRTLGHLARYPEMDSIWELLKISDQISQ
jgi:hypothetical protein